MKIVILAYGWSCAKNLTRAVLPARRQLGKLWRGGEEFDLLWEYAEALLEEEMEEEWLEEALASTPDQYAGELADMLATGKLSVKEVNQLMVDAGLGWLRRCKTATSVARLYPNLPLSARGRVVTLHNDRGEPELRLGIGKNEWLGKRRLVMVLPWSQALANQAAAVKEKVENDDFTTDIFAFAVAKGAVAMAKIEKLLRETDPVGQLAAMFSVADF